MTSNIARKVVQSFLRAAPQVDESVTLSPREREVLELLACGYLYKEIADKLGITVATVVTYIRRIYEKLHVRSRAQAVAKYGHFATGRTWAKPGGQVRFFRSPPPTSKKAKQQQKAANSR